MSKEFGNKRPTQAQRVLEFLKTHKSLTQQQALNELGVWRLSSRISELKNDGELIIKRMIKVKNRWDEECNVAEYVWVGSNKKQLE